MTRRCDSTILIEQGDPTKCPPDRFEPRNPEIAEATPEMVSIATVLKQQSQLLMDIRIDVGKMIQAKQVAE